MLESEDAEPVHRARVALRRMRSALRLLGKEKNTAVADLRRELRWLAGVLGPARDWDVLLAETLPRIARARGASADLRRIAGAARRRQSATRAAAREALSSARYRALKARLARWLRSRDRRAGTEVALTDFAARKIRRRHKRLLRDASGVRAQTPERRHRVRIDGKRLRYTVEFFGPLFPGSHVRRYLRDLVALQDALGAINDAANAVRLLARLHPDAATTRRIQAWFAAREKNGLAEAQRALQRIRAARRFWKAAA